MEERHRDRHLYLFNLVVFCGHIWHELLEILQFKSNFRNAMNEGFNFPSVMVVESGSPYCRLFLRPNYSANFRKHLWPTFGGGHDPQWPPLDPLVLAMHLLGDLL